MLKCVARYRGVTTRAPSHFLGLVLEAKAMIDRSEAGSMLGSPRVDGPFRAFYEHFGPTLCGEALTEVLLENGVPTQYFRNLALEERIPGQVSLKSLGASWLALRPQARPESARAEGAANLEPVDLSEQLPRHAEGRYERRPLSEIRYIVIHHTGASSALGPRAIAEEHVGRNGWPGIGYHYVIDPEGTVYRTQDIGLSSFHVAQFNPVSVGIALTGDFTVEGPTQAQLVKLGSLCDQLRNELGLPETSVRGHGEMVRSECPGAGFMRAWRPQLMDSMRRLQAEDVGAWESSQVNAAPLTSSDDGVSVDA